MFVRPVIHYTECWTERSGFVNLLWVANHFRILMHRGKIDVVILTTCPTVLIIEYNNFHIKTFFDLIKQRLLIGNNGAKNKIERIFWKLNKKNYETWTPPIILTFIFRTMYFF